MSSDSFTITTSENEVELILTDTEVILQLGEKIRNEVRNELEDAKDDIEDAPKFLRGFIRGVMRIAGKAADLKLACPVSDIAKADYTNGTIVFTYSHKPKIAFEDITVDEHDDKRPALSLFTEADSMEFVSRFNVLKHK